jgi:hypothetical protein
MPISWDLIRSIIDTPTLVASAVIALVIAGFVPRKTRAAVIWIAQYAAFVGLAFAVVGAGRAGYAIGGAMGLANNFNEFGQLYCSLAGAGIGGIAGFAGGALVLSPFFVLFEIAANTKKS